MTRVELHYVLKALLGSDNVYYKPPGKERMKYPAILYDKDNYESTYSDNEIYAEKVGYLITVLSTSPDNPVINKIRKLPYAKFVRCHVSDNIYHDVIKIYI